jgi:hypothetical protein
MKRNFIRLSCAVVFAFGSYLHAAEYTFTFSDPGDGVSAAATFNATGSDVTSGSITVTGGALPGTFSLDSDPGNAVTSVRSLGGDDSIFDNIYTGTDPAFDNNGLGFSTPLTSPGHANYVVNPWGNGPGNYTLYEAGNSSPGQGRVYAIYNGSGSVVESVPDGGLTIAMLGMGVAGLAFIRRKL